jgi:hypothetical protein
MLATMLLAVSESAVAQRQRPDVLLMNASSLSAAAMSYTKDRSAPAAFVAGLMREAEAALTGEPVSVMQKEQVPPSGDKHDFMSLGPYWWPDTTKPDGLPYIRRDGERNPEYNTYGDNLRLDIMVNRIETLALAYTVSRDERFAQKAVEQLNVWFLDPASRMNPNLNFAQAIKGITPGRGIGIIETYSYRWLVDGLILLAESKAWNADIDRGIRTWFSEYLQWLLESPNGKDESGEKNNHGSAYDVQTSCVAFYLGKADVARKILSQVGTKRIARQVEPDGSQPLELARTKSWGYSNMNLDALIELARLGERVGIDLWNFETRDGRSIRKAVDFLLPYAVGKKKWTHQQIVPFVPERMYFALSIAAEKYKAPQYIEAARVVQNEQARAARSNFSLPPMNERAIR